VTAKVRKAEHEPRVAAGEVAKARAGAARNRAMALLGLALVAWALLLVLADQSRALTTIAKPRFFEKPTSTPNLVAVGEVLGWDAIDPTDSYVLRRKIVGRPYEFALVKNTAAVPPAIHGETVPYAVKSIFGNTWSAEVSITYPLSGELGGTLPGEVLPTELSERRFFERPAAAPRLEVSGEALSWEALDPTNSYVLRRKVPGRNYEYALVKLNSALPAAFPGQTVTYAVKTALGSSWSLEVPIAYPGEEKEPPVEEKEPPPPTEPSCDLYASVEGSDENSGSLASPLRTVKALVQELEPGQTGCLTSGQTFVGSFTLYDGDSQGEARKPITITSTNPARPATIYGRVVTQSGVDWLTFTGLKFRWRETNFVGLPQITVGSDHTSWTYNDIENGNTTICINTIISSVWGTAHYTLIDHNRVHNCGGPVGYETALSNGYHSHGIYATGYHTTITNNYLYHESGRGVQLRGSHYSIVEHNIIDENGAGMVIGDLGSNYNEVAYNIITGSSASINGCCNVYGVYSWWGSGSIGSANSFHNNCLYANQEGNIDTSGGGFSATNNTIANPKYVDEATRNYTLQSTSPCLGYGPDTAQP
jgi:Right handed beta helix region